jgi:hypothetical protein
VIKTAAHGKGKNGKILMAFRFRREVADSIKQIAKRNHQSQARVLEILITRYAEELRRDPSSHRISNCCADALACKSGAEQNPQVPLASEDASFWQVPGNAETAVGRPAPQPPCAAAGPISDSVTAGGIGSGEMPGHAPYGPAVT